MEVSLLYHLFVKYLVVMEWVNYLRLTYLGTLCKCRNSKNI